MFKLFSFEKCFRFVVYHPSTGKRFYSKNNVYNEKNYEDGIKIVRECAQPNCSCYFFDDIKGNKVIFPKKFFDECVHTIEIYRVIRFHLTSPKSN